MSGPAHRLLAAVTAMMPPGRRAWGRALLAELDYTGSRRGRARLVLGAVRVALVPPPGLAGYGRAAGRAALVAFIAWIPPGAGVFLTNVVFPSQRDNGIGDAALLLYVIITLMAAGAAVRHTVTDAGHPVVAGMVAGLVIAALGMGTFAVIDNAFLSVIGHQQANIDGFRLSGAPSMRAYVNGTLEATAPGVALLLVLAGAFLGLLGAKLDRELSIARARRRSR
jgi:hypothetical protein